jgi:asparagine synthase (glutamine-hydrolysing)
MPGINLLFQHEPINDAYFAKIGSILDKMKYTLQYASSCERIGRDLVVGTLTYPGYPLTHTQAGPNHCFIEGFVYGKSRERIDALLGQIIEDPLGRSWNDRKKLEHLLLNCDGEFALVVANPETGDIHILNDALGRITYYYLYDGQTFVLAREPKFITTLADKITLSLRGMAEALMFMYPLGAGTMFTEMKKLPPATLISISTRGRSVKFDTIFKWNFSENQETSDPKKAAEKLIQPFVTSSGDRAETFRDRTNIIALSGGLDSRTVLAGLMKHKIDLKSFTAVDHRGSLLHDLPVAKELAALYGLKNRRLDLPGIDIDDMNRLINMKDGHGTGGIIGTVMKSLEILLNDYGHGCSFYTGDGGGLILAPRCPAINLRNADNLGDQILRRNAFFSVSDAAFVFRIEASELKTRLYDYFLSYPESGLRDKFGHFSIFEHLYRLSFEGEDRVRFFFWSNTPFYSMPFFYDAMLLSDYTKDNHRLFAEFHRQLDSRIARIKYSNWGFPISSSITPFYLMARNWALNHESVTRVLRKAIYTKRILSRHGRITAVDSDVILMKNHLEKLMAENQSLNEYLDFARINELLPAWENLLQLYSITNIITYLSNLTKSGIQPLVAE